MEKTLISKENNTVHFIEEIFGGTYHARTGIYLGTYKDLWQEIAIVTLYPDLGCTVIRHIPQNEIYTTEEEALRAAFQKNKKKLNW